MSQVQSPDEFIHELWSYAQEVPMAQHPWFHGILHHRWAPEQLILGEIQHYLRVRTNPIHQPTVLGAPARLPQLAGEESTVDAERQFLLGTPCQFLQAKPHV